MISEDVIDEFVQKESEVVFAFPFDEEQVDIGGLEKSIDQC